MFSYESTTTLLKQESQLCTLIQDLLPLYAEGEVSPVSHDMIAEHLSQCERCSGFLAGARSVRAQLRREHIEVGRVLAADQPAQQSMQAYQRIAKAVAIAVMVPIGVVIAGQLWPAVAWQAKPVVSVGALTTFVALVLAFARRRRLSTADIVALGTASFAGSLGLITLLGGDIEAPYFFSAIAFIVGSLALIWSVAGRSTVS